ncbi:ATP-binding cassette domain-containing protein [Streptomyces marincola]|uniref:ATP-binding cassette domain-containing protein n=1 Tax=Streptomyces marincola TaxID=2878388 RepID=UPI001CF15604|nr:ATP-binding cassette domain-containing protein [Streptomyces marincola]UCM87643.1 ATP-binding cassette domain-containing protein [Streptomyces marincola]
MRDHAVFRYLRRNRRPLAVLAAWGLLPAAQTFLLGYGLARALDDGFLAGRTGVGLAWLAAAGGGVLAGAFGTARVHRAVGALAEPLRDGLVREVVARGLHRAVRAGRPESGTADVSRLTHQVEIARDSFAGLVLVLQMFVCTLAGSLAGLASLAPVLLPVVLGPLLLALALFAWSLRPLARRQRAVLVADEALADAFGETAGGLRDITAAGVRGRAEAAVGARVDAELAAALALGRWGAVRVVALGIGGQLPVLLLLFLGPWLLRNGVTPGGLLGALTFVTQALLPALQALLGGVGSAGTRLAVVIARLRTDPLPPQGPPAESARERAGAAVEPSGSVVEPSGSAPAERAGPAPAREARAPGVGAARRRPAVELRGVTFAYGGRADPVLDGLDLAVPPGGHLAVVGPSGAGKSTLAALAAGLLAPRAGRVALCGRPVAGRTAAELAALRVLIPQEAYVFRGSVADNLSYLRAAPPPAAALTAAAEAVGAGDLLDRLGGPAGQVDPAALSAGERQLLALTRAFLSPAPVALLDEATCHLDPAAEAGAERAFAARPGGTLVVIAHRISSARRADRVLVLDGAEAHSGTPRELLDRSALFRDLAAGWSDPARAPGDADGVDAVAGPGLADDGGQVVAHRALREP